MGFQFTRKMDMAPFKDEVELGPSGESEAEQSLLYPTRWYKPRFPRSVKSLLIIQWAIIALLSIPGVVSWLGLLKTAPSGDSQFKDQVFCQLMTLPLIYQLTQ